MWRSAKKPLLAFTWACCGLLASATLAAKENFMPSTLIDLTYAFDEHTLYWPTEDAFTKQVEFHGMTEQGYFYSANRLHMAEHGGTHLDAPLHFNQNGKSVDAIPPEDLIGPGVLLDVSAQALQNRDYLVSVEDIQNFEQRHGAIPERGIVLIKTGYGKYWPQAEKYLGTREKGAAAIPQLRFPGLAPAAARWLVQERRIKAVGIDTASIDNGKSTDFLSHRVLAEAQALIFENVAVLGKLPPNGFEIIALPMKIAGGSGAPLRIMARIFGDEAQR